MTVSELALCPECGSRSIWKDGIRYVKGDPVQRYLCRECGYRFSLKTSKSARNVHTEALSTLPGIDRGCQICALEAKNLVKVESRLERAAGATKQDTKSILFNYSWYMKKEGYRDATINSYTDRIRKLIRRGAILSDTEQTKKIIASVPSWGDGTKKCMVEAYDVFVKMQGLEWKRPHYTRRETLPFIPTEKELDTLIAGCGKKVRAYLQGLKETGADPGELYAINWKDIDFERKKVAINHPVKGHNPRILNVSDEWLRMISQLPRTTERVWTAQYDAHYSNFYYQRKRLAHDYDNPRLKQISFRTIRHWKGTMEYHRTHDLMHVKQLLGHKTVQSTEIYIHLEETLFQQLESEYVVRRAMSVRGMMALASVGFEKFDETNGIHLYRKLKSNIT